jgi:hypothetical protein
MTLLRREALPLGRRSSGGKDGGRVPSHGMAAPLRQLTATARLRDTGAGTFRRPCNRHQAALAATFTSEVAS